MKTQSLEALMNQGFRKGLVEDRDALLKDFTIKRTPMIEIYELQSNEWRQVYYGHLSYVEKLITKGSIE